ncbi:MAG: peptidase M56 BlaR1 [Lachnospiraceae bacterium]|nr:peptidase M56 BlaR1 [Lachnospiraceae bacterium]
MDVVFYWLLNMSILASAVGIIVLLIRKIRHIPRRVIVLLWAIPLVRFLVPFGIRSKFSLLSLLPRYAVRTVPISELVTLPAQGQVFLDVFPSEKPVAMTNIGRWAVSYKPMTYKVDLLADVFDYASFVWAVIAAAVLITLTLIYFVTKAELRGAKRMYDNVYSSQKITSPAVYGILRPRIIIPEHLRDAEGLDLILLHEKRHIRRGDNFWRLLAFITAAIHWFNPFVWIFLKCFLSDVELACDESALAKLPREKQKAYALELLNVQQSKTVFASAFGGAKIRTRIEHIISYKKMTVFSALLFAAFVAAVAYMLLTNAA